MSDIDATNAAIKLAKAKGIDLKTVQGTGEDGRILKGDVEKEIEEFEKIQEALDANEKVIEETKEVVERIEEKIEEPEAEPEAEPESEVVQLEEVEEPVAEESAEEDAEERDQIKANALAAYKNFLDNYAPPVIDESNTSVKKGKDERYFIEVDYNSPTLADNMPAYVDGFSVKVK